MKYMVLLVASLLLLGCRTFAAESSRQALADELMEVMDIRGQMLKSVEVMKRNLPGQMAQMLSAVGAPQGPSNQVDLMDQTLDALFTGPEWEQVQQEMAGIYADVFTEGELQGLIAFYRSPIGKAFLDKQPEIMQKSMVVHQKMMVGIMPRLQEIMKASRPTPTPPPVRSTAPAAE